jgi:hypothetical protein
MRTRRLAALLTVAAVLLAAAPALAAGTSPEGALGELNAWRALAGIPGVGALDPSASEGCRLHNTYMALTGKLEHEEDGYEPGFTEAGSDAAEHSVLAGREHGPRGWENAVYHRMGLLNPRLAVTGFAASDGHSCMRTLPISNEPAARAATLALYPWPARDARGVPLQFSGGEVPDPRSAVGGRDPLGFLLSVSVNGPWDELDGSRLTGVSLTAETGEAVPVAGQDVNSTFGSLLSDGFALFPLKPLAPGTWYTARATGAVAGSVLAPNTATGLEPGTWVPVNTRVSSEQPFDLAWRFQTLGSSLGVTGRLAGGHVTARLAVAPAEGQRVTVTAMIQKRGRGWTRVSSRTVRATRRDLAVRLRVPTGTARVRVSASFGRFRAEGVVYPSAQSSRTLVRGR